MKNVKLNVKFKDFFWNTIGNIIFSLISVVLSIVTINVKGSYVGGIFSFGYSTIAYFVFTFGYFGIRNYHISDVIYEYSFKDYFNFRLYTCIISYVLGCFYILFMYFNNLYLLDKTIILVLVIIFGVVEAFYDCIECELQRMGLLYLSGQALFFRSLIFTSIYCLSLFFIKNYYYCLILAIISKILTGFYFDFYIILKYKKNIFDFKFFKIDKSIIGLLKSTLPLFLIILFDIYIYTSTKFTIDYFFGDYYNGLYNLIFLPTNIIYLICSMIMRPFITPLSKLYNDDKNKYNDICNKIFKMSIVLCLMFIVFGFFLSKVYIYIINFVTNSIYFNILSKLDSLFCIMFILIGGVLYALVTPLFNMLIIEKKIIFMFYAYLVLLIISILFSIVFVSKFGLLGAGLCFMILMLLLNVFIHFVRIRC